ncbi:M23 family metallopeptidase, partial [Pseudonocardia oceani]
ARRLIDVEKDTVVARHRSPSGARASDPHRMMQVGVGTHRLPPPPGGTSRARVLVAAVAAGAAVAGAETVIASVDDGLEPVVLSAVLPVPDPHTAAAPSTAAWNGIGGDQALPAAVAAAHTDDSPEVDVRNLTKAVEMGQELARRAAILDSALASGAPGAALFGDSAVAQPVVGRVTSAAGPRWGTTHNGLDVANAIGTPIFAVTDGVVEKSGPASGFGLWVVLRHPDGTRSVYGHINRTYVEVGQQVSAGEQIAEVGNRGFSTGPHLHLEIWDADGTKLDPAAWLRERGIDI